MTNAQNSARVLCWLKLRACTVQKWYTTFGNHDIVINGKPVVLRLGKLVSQEVSQTNHIRYAGYFLSRR